ncbi:hypothetical protein [Actinomadura rudentiformis]|nr:hypothetical protein [Actinomadura rudentiformis]
MPEPAEIVPTRPAHQAAVRPEDGPQDVPQDPGTAVASEITDDGEDS